MVERPSPNRDARPPGQAIDILLIHYTGMPSAAAALARLCDPASRVSGHYCIDEDGTIHRLVAEAERAWHAGVAMWRGATDINARSIGIELVNPGHEFGYRPFPEAQMRALTDLARAILARHPMTPARVLGHSDVAPLRKEDPGELFDWPRLAAAGIGLWPDPGAQSETTEATEATVRARLAAIGYGYVDQDFAAVVRAFQRHYRPEAVTGRVDAETAARLESLYRQLAES